MQFLIFRFIKRFSTFLRSSQMTFRMKYCMFCFFFCLCVIVSHDKFKYRKKLALCVHIYITAIIIVTHVIIQFQTQMHTLVHTDIHKCSNALYTFCVLFQFFILFLFSFCLIREMWGFFCRGKLSAPMNFELL